MLTIDEEKLESDADYRFKYLAEFVGFTEDDARAILAFAPHLGPRIPALVDTTYEKLLGYDATARHFVSKQHGFDGEPPADLASLTLDHPQIRFRKDHLNRYLMQLIGRSYDAKMVMYLDMVGKMHTSKAGNKDIRIPLVQMNALMGLLSDILIKEIISAPIDDDSKSRTLLAFNKIFWIQNDFISRNYTVAEL